MIAWNWRYHIELIRHYRLFKVRINNKVKVGYSYNKLTINLGDYNNGSHEISLLFDLGLTSNMPLKRKALSFDNKMNTILKGD